MTSVLDFFLFSSSCFIFCWGLEQLSSRSNAVTVKSASLESLAVSVKALSNTLFGCMNEQSTPRVRSHKRTERNRKEEQNGVLVCIVQCPIVLRRPNTFLSPCFFFLLEWAEFLFSQNSSFSSLYLNRQQVVWSIHSQRECLSKMFLFSSVSLLSSLKNVLVVCLLHGRPCLSQCVHSKVCMFLHQYTSRQKKKPKQTKQKLSSIDVQTWTASEIWQGSALLINRQIAELLFFF